jgi:hypothetical protein
MHSFRILAGSLAVLLLSATASTQDLTFTRDEFGSYAGSRAIVAGDFDRNGWPDLALANAGRNTATILLNDGGGEMRRAFDVAVRSH